MQINACAACSPQEPINSASLVSDICLPEMDASLHARTYTWMITRAWLQRGTNGTMPNALQHKSTEPLSIQVGYCISSKGFPGINSSMVNLKAIILKFKSQTHKGTGYAGSLHVKPSWRALTYSDRQEFWAWLGWECKYWSIREGYRDPSVKEIAC